MTARTRAHVLTVKTTYDTCEGGECFNFSSRLFVPCPSHRNMEWKIRCPYGEAYDLPGRTCTMYKECDCPLTDELEDELHENESGDCPDSPTGLHHYIGNGDIFPGIPVVGCWAIQCNCTDEHVEEFQLHYGDGTWAVTIEPCSLKDCDEGVDFTPIARLET